MSRLVAALLACMALSACTSTQYIHVKPECTPPPSPALPELSKGELWDKLGDSEYRRLERYINGVWAFSDEQGAMLEALCND